MINWFFLIIAEKSYLEFVFNLIVIMVGFLANMSSIYIFSRKSLNKGTNVGYLHSILCIVNIFPLFNSIFLNDVLPNYDINILDDSVFSCKFLNFWKRFTIGLSSFQQLFITYILFLSVKFPNKFLQLQNKRKLILFLFLIFMFMFIVNLPFFFYEINPDLFLNDTDDHSVYTNICNASIDLASISILLNILIRFIIPLVIMFMLNLIIIKYFNNSRVKKLFLKTSRKNKPKNFLRSIFIINFLFFVFHLPWTVFNFILIYLNYSNSDDDNAQLSNLFFVTYEGISLSISYINYTTPFFVHILFNKYFKLEVVNLFKKIWKNLKPTI